MRVRSGPEAQVYSLFVLLGDVVPERNIELFLDFRIAFPVPLRKPKERPVARVIRKRLSERVTGREVDAQVLKSLEQVGIVRIEQIAKVHALRISTPLNEETHQVESPSLQRQIKG